MFDSHKITMNSPEITMCLKLLQGFIVHIPTSASNHRPKPNVGKTIINHPQNHHVYSWYKSFPVMGVISSHGWFITTSGSWHCFTHINSMIYRLIADF